MDRLEQVLIIDSIQVREIRFRTMSLPDDAVPPDNIQPFPGCVSVVAGFPSTVAGRANFRVRGVEAHRRSLHPPAPPTGSSIDTAVFWPLGIAAPSREVTLQKRYDAWTALLGHFVPREPTPLV